MGWMWANKRRLNPLKMEMDLVASSLVLGSSCIVRLAGDAPTPKASVCKFRIHQMAAVARRVLPALPVVSLHQ